MTVPAQSREEEASFADAVATKFQPVGCPVRGRGNSIRTAAYTA